MATINGTAGSDFAAGGAAADQISGLAGNDTLSGGAGADTASGGTGNDVIEGGDGADIIYGGTGDDYLAGQDLVDPAGSAVSGTLNPAVSADDGAGDLLHGGAGNDTIFGGGGNDLMLGGIGNDVMLGGADADTMIGGLGADTMLGGSGADLMRGDEGLFTPPGAQFGGSGRVTLVNQITGGDQSPPVSLVLGDGRVVHVWINSATDDNGTIMELQARIFHADGSPASDQINLDSLPAVDGWNEFDWDNLSLDLLPDGGVVVSYVRNTSEPGDDEPVFAILTPTETGLSVALPATVIQTNDTTTYESPPVTTVLQNGNVLFVWSKNGGNDDASMTLQGRIYTPSSGTWLSDEFRVGSVAVDGSNGYDVPNLAVTQLTGGNVAVTWLRSNSAIGNDSPVYTVLSQNGAVIQPTTEIQQINGAGFESPAVIVALKDGGWVSVWSNDGLDDDTSTMTLKARIFNADGTPATGDIPLGAILDGSDGFDTDQISIVQLSGGRVAIGYVETYVTGGTNYPEFVILDPVTGSVVVPPQQIVVGATHPWPGPPTLAALGDSGAFVAVYAEGNQFSGGVTGLNYRIFASDGTPLTGQVAITGTTGDAAMSGDDAFDWNQLNVVYNATNNSFVVSWVGSSDGSGTGVYSSGPIAGPGGLTGPAIDPAAGSADVLDGGADADTILGGGGNDTLTGGSGNDSLSGGVGDDQLSGGLGADTMDGGDGVDSFVLTQGDSASGGTGNDIFTLSDLAEPGGAAITISGGSGRDLLYLGGTFQAGTLVRTGDKINGFDGTVGMQDGSLVSFSQVEGIVCFTRGTLIDTPSGKQPIERLSKGDLVTTDTGAKPIRWIGNRRLDQSHLAANPALAPVVIPVGALGPGLPARDLVVSPQHRILIENRVVARMFDAPAILVPAKDLVGAFGIRRDTEACGADYWHFLFDAHHIVCADDAWAESLYPGSEALKGLPSEARSEVLSLFPQLALLPVADCFAPARPFHRGAKVARMVERIEANGRTLVERCASETLRKTG
ncbi:MAG: hypothetical protein CFE34_11125 [Rhodobacteraceae bacterium PARR1]|nr:MAG: hypothetical protein CFE34_11125 [Rhodobacteraceae bacterium PARR1]